MRTRSTLVITLDILLAAALTACGSSSSSSSPTASAAAAPTGTPTMNRTPGAVSAQADSPTATPPGAASPVAAPTTLDPCQVVTAAEAGALAGTTFTKGTEERTGTSGLGKRCTYGSQTGNVFFVQIGVATNAAAAQQEWTRDQAQVEAALAQMIPGPRASFTTGDLKGLGDRAAVATLAESLGGRAINGTTIAVLKGATFLAFGDLVVGGAAPTKAAMQAQAQTSLARLP